MRVPYRQFTAFTFVLLLAASAQGKDAFVVEGTSGFTTSDWDPSGGAREPSCGFPEPNCGTACDYPEYCCEGVCPHRWLAGVELTVLKPVASNLVAFNTETNDLDTSTIVQSDFDYNMAFAPRVFLEVVGGNNFGLRATYWVADQTAPEIRATVPADSTISSPVIGLGFLEAIPGETFDTFASFSAHTIDLEGVKHVPGSLWKLCFSGGVRYAFVEQNYHAERRDGVNSLSGVVDYDHRLQGVGPTFAIVAGQPLSCRLSVFGQARASVLFGETATRLDAGDVTVPAFLTSTASRHDLFSMTELQVGLQWSPECEHPWQPLVRVAFEGQLWDGPGGPSQEGGLFGLYGLNVALGMAW